MPETLWLYVFEMLRRIAARWQHRRICNDFYGRIVALSRHPVPYARWGVPDTVEGRFEMLTLCLFLVLERLRRAGPPASDLAQSLVDAFFADLDAAHRQMGVGDLKVPRRMRELAEVFSDRLRAYRVAVEAGGRADLSGAIAKHFGGHDPAAVVKSARLAACAMNALDVLDKHHIDALKQQDAELSKLLGCKA